MAEEEEEEELLDYEEEDVAPKAKAAAKAADGGGKAKGGGDSKKKGYVGMHSTGFRDFLLKPELLRAIVDCGFEHPSEGARRSPSRRAARALAPSACSFSEFWRAIPRRGRNPRLTPAGRHPPPETLSRSPNRVEEAFAGQRRRVRRAHLPRTARTATLTFPLRLSISLS